VLVVQVEGTEVLIRNKLSDMWARSKHWSDAFRVRCRCCYSVNAVLKKDNFASYSECFIHELSAASVGRYFKKNKQHRDFKHFFQAEKGQIFALLHFKTLE